MKIYPQLLRSLGCDVKTVFDYKLEGVRNSELVETSVKEERAIVTLDFILGYRYYFKNREKLGIILLRLSDLTVENINQKLRELFESTNLTRKNTFKNLIVVHDNGYDIFK